MKQLTWQEHLSGIGNTHTWVGPTEWARRVPEWPNYMLANTDGNETNDHCTIKDGLLYGYDPDHTFPLIRGSVRGGKPYIRMETIPPTAKNLEVFAELRMAELL